jgi:hypothetical protein
MSARQRSSCKARFNHCSKFGSAAASVDKCRLFLNGLRLFLIVLFMYYYVEVFFRGGSHLTSYPHGSFLPTV